MWVETRRYHGHCEERAKWPDSFAEILCLETIPRTLFVFRIFIQSVKINLFLLSEQFCFFV